MNGTVTAPGQSQAERYTKFMSRRDRALATIQMLSYNCCYHCLFGSFSILFSCKGTVAVVVQLLRCKL